MEECSPNGSKNTVGKEEIAPYEQFLLFPVFSKDFYYSHVKTRACLGKGKDVQFTLVRIINICIHKRGPYL